jgi:hypothetical protein
MGIHYLKEARYQSKDRPPVGLVGVSQICESLEVYAERFILLLVFLKTNIER